MKKVFVIIISLLFTSLSHTMHYYEISHNKMPEPPTVTFEFNDPQQTSNTYLEMGVQSYDHESLAYQYSNQLNHKDPTGRIEYIPKELAKELLPKVAKFVPKDSGPLKKPDMSKDLKMKVLQQAYLNYEFDTLLHYLRNESNYLKDSEFKFSPFNFFDSLANGNDYYMRSRYLSFLLKVFSDPAIKGLFEIYKAKGLDQAETTYESFLKDLTTWHQQDNKNAHYTAKLDESGKERLKGSAYRVLTNRRDYEQKKYEQFLKEQKLRKNQNAIGGRLSPIDYSKTIQHQSEISSEISVESKLPPIDYSLEQREQTQVAANTNSGGRLSSIDYSGQHSHEPHASTETFSYIKEMQTIENEIDHALDSKQKEAFTTVQTLKELEQIGIEDPTSYAQATMGFIEEMEKKGLLEKHIDTQYEILQAGLASFFENIKPENPVHDPKGFLRDMCNIAAWSAFHSMTPGLCITAVETAMIGEKVYAICAQDYSGMKPKQRAELFGKTMAEAIKGFIAQKAFNTVAPKVTKFAKTQMSSGVASVVNKFKKSTPQSTSIQHIEVETSDGAKLTFQEKQQKFENLSNTNNQKTQQSGSSLDSEANLIVPQIGEKLKYIFGKATGSLHNIERSTDMARQLHSIGIFDNAVGKSYLENHLTEVLNNSTNILKVQNNGRVIRESLLMGPNGGLKMHSIWEGNKLLTMELFG